MTQGHGSGPANLGPSEEVKAVVSVMLVDDHEMVVQALSQIVSSSSGLEVVAQACSAEAAWEFLRLHSVDVLVTDLDLPGESGRALAIRVLEQNPRQGIVVLSYRVEPDEVHFLIEAGVRGYVPKSASASELSQAIRNVAAGFEHFSIGVVSALTESVRRDGRTRNKLLTLRQTVVLQLMSQGLTTRQIAEDIRLSPKTVEKYRGEIFRRLDCKNQVQALEIARRLHLLN